MPDVVFEIGARVHHERYGYGDVLDVQNQGSEITVVFDNDKNTERKVLAAMGMLRLVPLGEEPESERVVEPDPPPAPVPVAAPVKPALAPVPLPPDPVFKRGDEVGLVSHPSDAPIGLVSVIRPQPRGGYRVDLYSGGIMSFEARELRLTKAAPEPTPPAAKSAPLPTVTSNPFQRGDHVKHPEYGPGLIVAVYYKRSNSVRVRFATGAVLDMAHGSLVAIPNPDLSPVDLDPEPPPGEPDPLLTKVEAEILRRGPGSMAAVTRAAGVHFTMLHHWRTKGRITGNREAIRAWTESPWPWPPLPKEPDQLYVKMVDAIAKRGQGASAAVTAHAGVCKTAMTYWHKQKRIPEGARAAVESWINSTPVPTPQTFAPDSRVWSPGYGFGTVIKWYDRQRVRVIFDEYPSNELRVLVTDLWMFDDPAKPPRDETKPAFPRSREKVPTEPPKEEPMHPVHPAPATDKAPPTPVVPSNSGVDYNAVLADLIARRDQLDRAIDAVRALVTQ